MVTWIVDFLPARLAGFLWVHIFHPLTAMVGGRNDGDGTTGAILDRTWTLTIDQKLHLGGSLFKLVGVVYHKEGNHYVAHVVVPGEVGHPTSEDVVFYYDGIDVKRKRTCSTTILKELACMERYVVNETLNDRNTGCLVAEMALYARVL